MKDRRTGHEVLFRVTPLAPRSTTPSKRWDGWPRPRVYRWDPPRPLAGPLLLPRHLIWRRQYREDRYLRALSQAELNARIRDLILNQILLREDGNFSLIEVTEDTRHLPEVFTHALEEMKLRHGPYPAGFSREVRPDLKPPPDYFGDLARKAVRAAATQPASGGALVKFGKRRHMEALFMRGELRVQPATFYSRPDLNRATQDDELRFSLSVALSRDDIVRLVANPRSVPQHAPEQRIDIEFHARGNYWVYCVSTTVAPRLFLDFDADACVIIRDRAAFTKRLREAATGGLREASFASGRATYVDPLRPRDSRIFVPFAKHFRYTYQSEYRFAWVPRAPVDGMAHVDLELGSLRDIAELITL